MSRGTRKTRPRRGGRPKGLWDRCWPPLVVITSGVGLAGLAGWLTVPAPKKNAGQPEWLPLCPVGAFPLSFLQRLETADGEIFFCCPRCIERYRAAPTSYAAAVEAQKADLTSLPRIQVACPVSGDVPDPSIRRTLPAGDILFCSQTCAATFDSEGEASLQFADAYTYQRTCPVTGQAIDPQWSASVNESTRVFFCSGECITKFQRSPGQYAKPLAEQGFRGRL